MPPHTPNRDDRTHRDIRAFMSPPPASPGLQRRRRIVESSSSDEQNPAIQAGHQADVQPQLPPQNNPNNENDPPAPILIADSDDESSDSMFVARPAQAVVLQERNLRGLPQRQHNLTPSRQRRPSPQQQQPARRQRRRHAEAESTSEEESSGLSADESDQNAADLYRAAILGVRNRPSAAQQLRTDTIPCPVCAKFMEFLLNFRSR